MIRLVSVVLSNHFQHYKLLKINPLIASSAYATPLARRLFPARAKAVQLAGANLTLP